MDQSPSEDLTTEVGRIRALLGWAETNPTMLSNTAGLSPAHIGMLLRGEMKTLRRDTAEKVAAVTAVTGAWITYGGERPDPERVRAVFNEARRPRKTTPHTASDFIVTATPARNAPASPVSLATDIPRPNAPSAPREITVVRDAEWSQERPSVTGVGV